MKAGSSKSEKRASQAGDDAEDISAHFKAYRMHQNGGACGVVKSRQKICDACKSLGVEKPEYIVHGEDIMVKFKALQSAKVPK